MNRYFTIILIIPMWFALMLYIAVLAFFRVENQALEDWRLKKVVNNCTDSAIEELLNAGDLGQDYTELSEFKTDPDLALNDFVDTFLMSYGIPQTEDARESVKTNYIQTFMVAAYDGYYIYDHRETEPGGGYTLVSSPKIPYLLKDTSRLDRTITYALNFGNDKCYRLVDGTISLVDNPVDKQQRLKIINTRIADDLREHVDRAYKNGWVKSVNIPTEMTTVNSTNPITSQSVLAFVDNVDIDTLKPINAFGIGGSKVTEARHVAAYRRKNQTTGEWQKLYSYADLLPEAVWNDQTVIADTYTTIEEAAANGYYHDPLYMN